MPPANVWGLVRFLSWHSGLISQTWVLFLDQRRYQRRYQRYQIYKYPFLNLCRGPGRRVVRSGCDYNMRMVLLAVKTIFKLQGHFLFYHQARKLFSHRNFSTEWLFKSVLQSRIFLRFKMLRKFSDKKPINMNWYSQQEVKTCWM